MAAETQYNLSSYSEQTTSAKITKERKKNVLSVVNPELAAQWHPTRNGDLTPDDVTAGSDTEVWWFLPYDDPKTGKHFDFEWPAKIVKRTYGAGCPFLSGKAVWRGFNDLATTNPDLAAQWHPTKNGDLTPYEVTFMSTKEVWWLLPYDDPKTGKHFDFEWPAKISSRTSKGNGCPFLSGRAAWRGYNDLATTDPDLVAQWHPTKNGDLTPYEVTFMSTKEVWWFLPYDDPKTGKHFDFEWPAKISNRTSGGNGCPFLSGNAVWRGFNDLATTHPDLAKEWHPTKNGNLTPYNVTAGKDKDVWWFLPYDDPKTGKHFGFEWPAKIYNRIKGVGCPYLTGRAVWRGYNDLATTDPDLAAQWHPTKNGDLTPYDVTAGSGTEVWWFLPYDDPKTGKHFDFEWPAKIYIRSIGIGCLFLSGRAVWRGYNDLATTDPDLAAQWHPTKNGDLTPYDVTAGSGTEVWWFLPYDDPKTGKHFDFEWSARIYSRTGGAGCPYLTGRAAWRGFNDLVTTHPDLAAQWHPTKNGDLTPYDVTAGNHTEAWWLFPYDDPKTGKHFDFEWPSKICDRTGGNGCPFLSGNAVWRGFNDLATTHPNLTKEWHPTKNGNLTPYDVTAGSSRQNVWWLLPYDDPKTGKHFDFEWPAKICDRTNGNGCPFLSEPHGEEWVRKYLSDNNTIFERQKTFNGLYGVGNRKLSYDFVIPDSNILIEYNGIQHYKPIEHFGGEKQLKVQKEHDRRKRKYAKENGYTLIEISYKYDTYEKVAAYLDEHLLPLLKQIAA